MMILLFYRPKMLDTISRCLALRRAMRETIWKLWAGMKLNLFSNCLIVGNVILPGLLGRFTNGLMIMPWIALSNCNRILLLQIIYAMLALFLSVLPRNYSRSKGLTLSTIRGGFGKSCWQCCRSRQCLLLERRAGY